MKGFKNIVFRPQRDDRSEQATPATAHKRSRMEMMSEADRKFCAMISKTTKPEVKPTSKPKRVPNEPTSSSQAFSKGHLTDAIQDTKSAKKMVNIKVTPFKDNLFSGKAMVMKIFSNSFKTVNPDAPKPPPTPTKSMQVKKEMRVVGSAKMASVKSFHHLAEASHSKNQLSEPADGSPEPKSARPPPTIAAFPPELIPSKSTTSILLEHHGSLHSSQAKIDVETNLCTLSMDKNPRLDPKETVSSLRDQIKSHPKLIELLGECKSNQLNYDQIAYVLSISGFFDSDNESQLFRTADDNVTSKTVFESFRGVKAEDQKVDADVLVAVMTLLRSLEARGLLNFRKKKTWPDLSPSLSMTANAKKKSSLSNKHPSIIKQNSFTQSLGRFFDEGPVHPFRQTEVQKIPPPAIGLLSSQSPVDRPKKDFEHYDCSQFTFKKPKRETSRIEQSNRVINNFSGGSPDLADENSRAAANRADRSLDIDANRTTKLTKNPRFASPGLPQNSPTLEPKDPGPEHPNVFQTIDIQSSDIRKPLFTTTITFHQHKFPLEVYEDDNIPQLVTAFIQKNSIDPNKQEILCEILEREKKEKLRLKNERKPDETKHFN